MLHHVRELGRAAVLGHGLEVGEPGQVDVARRPVPLGLVGDAGVVAPPFTGSGVFKGYQNVSGLLAQLTATAPVDGALEAWSAEQVRLGDRLLALGDQMEQAFIWDSLDLAQADAASTEAWWHAAVQFPDEFTYEARS